MTIKHSYRIVLHKERNGSFAIRMRLTLYGQKPIDYAIGHSIPSRDLWNEDRQRAKNTFKEATEINRAIAEAESSVSDIMAKYELIEKRMPSLEELKHDISASCGRTKQATLEKDNLSNDFFFVFDKFMTEEGLASNWSHATHQKFKALRNKVLEDRPTLRMDEIDDNYINALFKKHADKGMKNTTSARQSATFRQFLRWASNNHLYNGRSHETHRPRLKGQNYEQKEVIYLSLDELAKVENHVLDINQRHLERVRDVFIFCCFTGLRFSDAAKLRCADIHDGYISVVTQKTSDNLRIKLNKHSQAILDKYAEDGRKGSSFALPAISNQKSNDYLKDIGELCGINEPTRIVYFIGNKRHEEVHPKHKLLSTHCARRTFVVTALQLGIDPLVIIKITGHKNIKSMQPYIKIVDKMKDDAIDKFNNI